MRCTPFIKHVGRQRNGESVADRIFLFQASCFHSSERISCTRPIRPSSSRTLIPREWKADDVRISLTTPTVRFPLRWSSFKIISTRLPRRISLRSWPFMMLLPLRGAGEAVDDTRSHSNAHGVGFVVGPSLRCGSPLHAGVSGNASSPRPIFSEGGSSTYYGCTPPSSPSRRLVIILNATPYEGLAG